MGFIFFFVCAPCSMPAPAGDMGENGSLTSALFNLLASRAFSQVISFIMSCWGLDLLLTDLGDADDVKFEVADFPATFLPNKFGGGAGLHNSAKTLGHGRNHVTVCALQSRAQQRL